ncbi:hypothetical protein QUF76_15895 [Desulfobacterales bacterium HSG16]|nr:hypothetical protein [Desulfobacterales bacterium HSG16]
MFDAGVLIKAVPVLIAAVIVGNWFLAEVKKRKLKGEPVYKAYFSLPGILIILIFMLPMFLKLIKG